MLFLTPITFNLVAIVLTLLSGLVVYFKWAFTYWKKRGLSYIEPTIPFGNTTKLFLVKKSFAEQFAEFYDEFRRRGLKHGGVFMFGRPFYIPTDPYIIKDMLQKDFQHFINRGFYVNEENDPLSGHLFSLEGTKWKNLRAKLTATFTSGKMKMMFDTMAASAKELDYLMLDASKTKTPVDIKEVLARFTTDVITSCAFGLDGNSLKNPDTPIRHYGKRVVENTAWESFKNFSQLAFPPKILDALKFKVNKTDVETFMLNLVTKTVAYREKNNVYRKDFLHLLLQLKNRGKIADDEEVFDENHESKEIGLTVNELAAQVFVFFVAGYETSAATMSFALLELSLHQDIQDKLRSEINRVLENYDNEISYDALMQMTYTDQVINETLRKHPPLAFLNRQCTKAYHVPNTNVHIEEGTMVVVPTLGIHYDKEFYPEPQKFDPERFSKENKNSRPPCTWMPFGEGPRVCIGERFGLLQSKLGLVTLLRNYKVTLNDKTEMPIAINPTSIITTSKSEIWLNVAKIN